MEVTGVSDLELEGIIKELIDDWSTDEMIELLGECEFVLSSNEGRIEQLKAKGLTRLWRMITGINKKNKLIALQNVHEIQKISLRIQRILMKRIDLVSSALISLNNKVNKEIFWTQGIINSLIEKLESLPDMKIMIHLTRWQNNVRNYVIRNGRKYIDASDGMKILLVVSDLFEIVHERCYLIDRPFLETTLKDKLDLHDQIKVSDFYKDIIYEKEGLFLYTKYNNSPSLENTSIYGQMIYKIDGFYADPYLLEMAENKNKSLENMCMEYFETKIQKYNNTVCSIDLCSELLNDLVLSLPRKQNELENKEDDKVGKFTVEEENDTGNCIVGNCKEYSIMRITPKREVCIFKNGVCIHKEIAPVKKDDCAFFNDEEIKEIIKTQRPSLIAAPSVYLRELKKNNDILNNSIKYISLTDYYMYLWFCENEDKRKGKVLEFIEYYRTDYYISVYVVNESGDGYRKGSPVTVTHHKRTTGHLKQDYDISCKLTAISNDVNRLVFSTFEPDRRRYRLEDSRVAFVNNTWESILEVDNDKIKNIIQDLVDRSYRIDNIILRRIDKK